MNARILCLEPFGGGSHAAFWRGWAQYSRHQFKLLDLPAVHWKWRSRHASLSLALATRELLDSTQDFDMIVCSDMLNLPEWRGLVTKEYQSLPCVAYFHENQFTYPLSPGTRRDFHFGYSNVLTAIAAQQVWFNSAFHRDEFSSAAIQWLRRMPDYKHIELFEAAMADSRVLPPGIESEYVETLRGACDGRELQARTPIIGWVARWEYDKRPDVFTAAIEQLIANGAEFELILLGQQFALQSKSLRRLEHVAQGRIKHVGFAASPQAYWNLLHDIDIVVSTADHDFFGVGIVESVAAGAVPLLPKRLAYPEVFGLAEHPNRACLFYGDLPELVEKLLQRLASYPEPPDVPDLSVDHYFWRNLVKNYDAAIDLLL